MTWHVRQALSLLPWSSPRARCERGWRYAHTMVPTLPSGRAGAVM